MSQRNQCHGSALPVIMAAELSACFWTCLSCSPVCRPLQRACVQVAPGPGQSALGFSLLGGEWSMYAAPCL